MKKEPGLLFRICLVIGDALGIVFAFAFAYFFRTHIDPRPFFFDSQLVDFIWSSVILIPFWLLLLAFLGLYTRRVLTHLASQAFRLLFASIFGVMSIITYDFFAAAVLTEHTPLFPVRIIALYAIFFCFLTLLVERGVIYYFRTFFLRRNLGLLRTILVGDSDATTQLALGISPDDGFKVVGIVAKAEFTPPRWRHRRYTSLIKAVARLHADAIIQTEDKGVEEARKIALDHHLLYYYSPAESSLLTRGGDIEFIAGTPITLMRATPLNGAAGIFKRFLDIIFSFIFIILLSPLFLILILIQKCLDPKAPVFYFDERLTRYNRHFGLMKFRSIKPEYSGMTPEEAFTKMGKPNLAKSYRSHGDYLKNDPRYTKFGRFLRNTSLDETPQFFNILKGDISFIGPRALQPGELEDYGDRGLLLSIKSGLTGLAQVSGRRDISFNERRALDIYYIQNWRFMLDVQIFFHTIAIVLRRDGAK